MNVIPAPSSSPSSLPPAPVDEAPPRSGVAVDRDRAVAGSSAAPVGPVERRGASDPLTLAGLGACVQEARAAAGARDDGPPDPSSFTLLRSRLQKAAANLPPEYRAAVGKPLLSALDQLGARGLARLLAEDPEREGPAGLILDAAQAVLQRGEGYQAKATAAFQEVVSDLYDGFVSAEARRGVKAPDQGAAPPLVRWGSADAGPYTWPAVDTAPLGLEAGVVSLPAANAKGGLLAWPALAHETAGHDIVTADKGLSTELARTVHDALAKDRAAAPVADYWSDRIDEVSADVLGVLNMGPAAAVGLIGYFRALNGAARGTASLRNVGREDDPHPADIARAYLAAETVRLLSFRGASTWADRLTAEADRDLGRIRLGDVAVTAGVAKSSAAAVARAILGTPLRALEGRTLREIQDWRDTDEAVVASLREALRPGPGAGGAARRGAAGPAAASGPGAFAAHAVAAGIYEAVAGGQEPGPVMDRMIALLDRMHAANPSWKAPGAATPLMDVA